MHANNETLEIYIASQRLLPLPSRCPVEATEQLSTYPKINIRGKSFGLFKLGCLNIKIILINYA